MFKNILILLKTLYDAVISVSRNKWEEKNVWLRENVSL